MVLSSFLVSFSMPPKLLLRNRKEVQVSQNSWYVYAFITFQFIYFLKSFIECEEELHWRNKVGYSYMAWQCLPASHSEESFFAFLDDKNFDRSLILFLPPPNFSVLTKTLGKPGSQTASFLLRQLVVSIDVTLEALYFIRTLVLVWVWIATQILSETF